MAGWSDASGKIMGPKLAGFESMPADFGILVGSSACVSTDCGKNSVGVVSDQVFCQRWRGFSEHAECWSGASKLLIT